MAVNKADKAHTEYRLVAELPNGWRKTWPKRDLAHAEKGLSDFRRDQERNHFYSKAVPWIEQRDVGEWEMVR